MEENIVRQEKCYGITCKICASGPILIENHTSKNKESIIMKILGIGNAIVDVICKVDDSFITQKWS